MTGGTLAPRPVVNARGLARTFPGEPPVEALRPADLTITGGEYVSIMGGSGSGKSTLLHVLGLLDRPTAGSYELEGRDTATLSDAQRAALRGRHIGFVFQSFNLIPTLTAVENLLLPLELNGTSGGRARATALDLLERVGLADRAGTYPDRLSGGEQQRVAAARAVVHDPAILLADEPTGSLDAETGKRVLELLVGLARDDGRTMVVVTHSDAVARAADRVLVLRDARLFEETLPGGAPA